MSFTLTQHVLPGNRSLRRMKRVVVGSFLVLLSISNLALSCGFHSSTNRFSIPTYDLECIKNGNSYDKCYVGMSSNKMESETHFMRRNPTAYSSFLASRLRSNQVDVNTCDLDSDCSNGKICSWKMGYFGVCKESK